MTILLTWVGSAHASCIDRSLSYEVNFSNCMIGAKQGDAEAQYKVAAMYGSGKGVDRDYKEARKWFLKAAEQGDARSQYNYGIFYYAGLGVDINYKEASKWFQKSAEQGYTKAQFNLGNKYSIGQGIAKDYVTAYKWFDLADVNGHKDASVNRGLVAKKMTPSQIAEAQELAREWTKRRKK